MNISNKKRMEKDIVKLHMSNYQLHIKDNIKMNEFSIVFKGPKESLYENGYWKVEVLLPDEYPFKSPSIGFANKIFHPNIEESSGTVCLDVINQTWSPMYELKNIFDVFLPQLLIYPNPSDPLNPIAANMMIKNKEEYEKKVRAYVEEYASKEIVTSMTSCIKKGNNILTDEKESEGKERRKEGKEGNDYKKSGKKNEEDENNESVLSEASFDKDDDLCDLQFDDINDI